MTTYSGAASDQRRLVVEVSHLRKTYSKTVAVDDVSFSVREDEIVGILGPNGAGKTTTVECLVGLRRPDSGTIRVLGLDPQRGDERAELHARVGVQLQASALPAKLKVAEILDLYHSFYAQPADVADLVERSGWPTSAPPITKTCPVARSSGCRLPWP